MTVYKRADDGSCVRCSLKHLRIAQTAWEFVQNPGTNLRALADSCPLSFVLLKRIVILLQETAVGYPENLPVAIGLAALLENETVSRRSMATIRDLRLAWEARLADPYDKLHENTFDTDIERLFGIAPYSAASDMSLFCSVKANVAEALREFPSFIDHDLRENIDEVIQLLGLLSQVEVKEISDFALDMELKLSYIVKAIEERYELGRRVVPSKPPNSHEDNSNPSPASAEDNPTSKNESSPESSANPSAEKGMLRPVE
jgi:hypothetical protein